MSSWICVDSMSRARSWARRRCVFIGGPHEIAAVELHAQPIAGQLGETGRAVIVGQVAVQGRLDLLSIMSRMRILQLAPFRISCR